MAGQPLGAAAPVSAPLAAASAHRAPAGNPSTPLPLRSRTRRLHALLALADDTAASVHSTRRTEQLRGVTLTLNSGEQVQALDLAPIEARQLACALLGAAEALELAQRHQRTPFGGAMQQGGAA